VTQRLGDRTKTQTIFKGGLETMNEMIRVVHQWGNPRHRVRATLQQVYNFAIRNKLREAREILMKTHMSQVIIMQPIENQILYNRALVQIGMAAFRLGKVKESHDILADICQNSKHKELLAQRISSIMDKSVEFEAEEKKRQIPFHFQINIQLLESIHFISSMLLEIPTIAANQFTLNKTPVSKNFKRLIEQYDSQAFHLAAETYKDHIVNAARALNQSDWKKAFESIMSIPLFT
jgi:translation initiation factor 3 subunit C